jgi:hypothetical protein
MSNPMNCAVLIGLPRSGTTIAARVIGGHSLVKPIIEPYQSRRREAYEVADFPTFLNDAGGTEQGVSLFIKETTTHEKNVELSLALLSSAEAAGVRPLLFLILRSPVEAYLSQVKMAQTVWDDQSGFDYSEKWVDVFAKGSLRQLRRVQIEAERYHRRVILYRRFVREAREETRRLMAAFPYPFEASQLDNMMEINGPRAGDPSAWTSKEVSEKATPDRSTQVQKFASDFGHLASAGSLLKLHEAIHAWSDDPDANDDFIWEELERLIRFELVRNGMGVNRAGFGS